MSDTSIIADQAAGRIVVIGGGASGLSCAWRLAGAGLKVTLIEAGEPGGGALHASGGMLAAGFESAVELQPDHLLASAFVRFAEAASDLWPGWAERLQAESGRALGYERRGSIIPIFTAEESERAAAAMDRARALGIETSRYDAAALHEAEPSLARALGAIVFPRDGQVDNRALGKALTEAARGRGVDIIKGRSVTGLERSAGRVTGVTLDLGDPVDAEAVILASGTGAISGAPPVMAMEPVKGQMIAFAAARPVAPAHVVRGFSIYLAAKPGTRLVAGATSEPGVEDPGTDDEAIARLTAAARAAIPGLVAAPVMERWAGLRPRTADSMPVIGEVEPGLLAAGGGYRNGVLLAPAIAEALAAYLGVGEDWPSAAPFSPRRPGLTGAER
ncbi:MAG: FAD-dependent oxidoreductase [Alphaproteobacteria bacterium]|nr:FAD-dependent oxidoreductase [Alphaproteobacteria bacterium]